MHPGTSGILLATKPGSVGIAFGYETTQFLQESSGASDFLGVLHRQVGGALKSS